MNDLDKRRCLEFAQLVLGRAARKSEVDTTAENCESFAEFRIALVLQHEGSLAVAKKVTARWRESLQKHHTSSNGNDLMHTAELLAMKHSEIEQQLRVSTADMLDKLRAIDTLATAQAQMRTRLSEIGDLVYQFRSQITQLDHDSSTDKGALK